MIDYEKFRKSLKHLELQFVNYQSLQGREGMAQLDREAVADSVIKRFEICYDSLWKCVKRHLVEVEGLPDIPNSPKPVFKYAGQNHLLPSPVEHWLGYADARIRTTHDYSEDKAIANLTLVGPFISDATALYSRLTGHPWE